MNTEQPDRSRLYRTLFARPEEIDAAIAEMVEQEREAERARARRRRWPWPIRKLRSFFEALNYYRKQF